MDKSFRLEGFMDGEIRCNRHFTVRPGSQGVFSAHVQTQGI